MNKILLLLSDIHVEISTDSDGEPKPKFESWLTDTGIDSNNWFIDEFTRFVKLKFPDSDIYLIVTGDISDSAQISEFTEASRLIRRIVDSLRIDLKNVLLLPGDHDVNRVDCNIAFRERDEMQKKAYDFQAEKFRKFSDFYQTFYSDGLNIFDPEKAITNYIKIQDVKILIIGLNSNFKIGTRGGVGFIPNELLQEELGDLRKLFPEYSFIVATHHNVERLYADAYDAQWEKENRLATRSTLINNDVRCHIYGNEHTYTSASKAEMEILSLGTFSKIQKTPLAFNVLEVRHVEETNELKLLNNGYNCIDHGVLDAPKFGKWDISNQVGDVKEIELVKPLNISQIAQVQELPTATDRSLPKVFLNESEPGDDVISMVSPMPENYVPFTDKSEAHQFFLSLIKRDGLFYTGHFHWSETSRAHNWIDVPQILSTADNLLASKQFILDCITQNDLKFDFIIGLGIEGNMLATRAAIKSGKPYSYLPYSYRYDDHSSYEKKLNFTNSGQYKTVLIITDVVHDGRTIRKLIHKQRQDDLQNFFDEVERILVISLFYTGSLPAEQTKYHCLLNKFEGDPSFDKLNDHEESRIQFHFLSHMKVETCPYTKENYRTDCLIVREGLGCVHKFYTEKSVISAS